MSVPVFLLKLVVYRQVSACLVHIPEAASYSQYKSLKRDLQTAFHYSWLHFMRNLDHLSHSKFQTNPLWWKNRWQESCTVQKIKLQHQTSTISMHIREKDIVEFGMDWQSCIMQESVPQLSLCVYHDGVRECGFPALWQNVGHYWISCCLTLIPHSHALMSEFTAVFDFQLKWMIIAVSTFMFLTVKTLTGKTKQSSLSAVSDSDYHFKGRCFFKTACGLFYNE